jgi:hypothetical protein
MAVAIPGVTKTTNGSTNRALNISAATVVKATAGRLVQVNVLVAGAVGAIYDNNLTSGNSAANQIAVIPAVVGAYWIDWPCTTGICVTPGAAQVVAVSYA